MPRQVFRVNCLAFLLTLSFASCRAQTLSNCRPTPPLPPNAKPGVGGLSLTQDGQTLVVAGGDAKIRSKRAVTSLIFELVLSRLLISPLPAQISSRHKRAVGVCLRIPNLCT